LRAETEERTSVYSLLDVKCATPARMPSDIACCDSSVVVAMVAVDEADEEDEVEEDAEEEVADEEEPPLCGSAPNREGTEGTLTAGVSVGLSSSSSKSSRRSASRSSKSSMVLIDTGCSVACVRVGESKGKEFFLTSIFF